MKSDQNIQQLICELIREAALRDAREELPHSIMVTIDEMSEREEKAAAHSLISMQLSMSNVIHRLEFCLAIKVSV